MNEKIEELRRIMSASRDDEMKEARRAGGVKLVFPTDIVQEYFEGYAHALRDLEQMFPEKPTVHTLASAKDGTLRLLEKRGSRYQLFLVAERYDEKTGSWACGHYYDDLLQAADRFNEILDDKRKEEEENDAMTMFALELYELVKGWKDRSAERRADMAPDYQSAISVQLTTQARDADMILNEIKDRLEAIGVDTDDLD